MRKVVLFIAMSLDGYIADMNGSLDGALVPATFMESKIIVQS